MITSPLETTTTSFPGATIWVDGTELTVRPIQITDVDRMLGMFDRLSRESIRFRFFSPLPKLPRAALLRLAEVDHFRRDALVALDGDEMIAVARYNAVADADGNFANAAEIAIAVEDRWHHRGVGQRLVLLLGALAVERGYETFVASILPDNRAALNLMRKLVPDAHVKFVGGGYEARLPLTREARAALRRSLAPVHPNEVHVATAANPAEVAPPQSHTLSR